MFDQQHMLLLALGCACFYILIQIQNTVNKILHNSTKFHDIIETRWKDTAHHVMSDKTIMADKDHNPAKDGPMP